MVAVNYICKVILTINAANHIQPNCTSLLVCTKILQQTYRFIQIIYCVGKLQLIDPCLRWKLNPRHLRLVAQYSIMH